MPTGFGVVPQDRQYKGVAFGCIGRLPPLAIQFCGPVRSEGWIVDKGSGFQLSMTVDVADVDDDRTDMGIFWPRKVDAVSRGIWHRSFDRTRYLTNLSSKLAKTCAFARPLSSNVRPL